MNILHITSHLRPGGITTYVTSVAEAQARRGHTVIVASGGGPLEPRIAAAGVQHWTVPLDTSAEANPRVLWSIARLARRLRREPVALIHAHTRVGQFAGWALARCAGVPLVTTWHGFFKRRWFRRVLPCTGERTIAISQPVADHLRKVFQVPAERIRVIAHGVDVARFQLSVDPARRAAIRRRLGVPERGLVVGTVSRLVASKGLDRLLAAFRQVHARHPGIRLLIVGDGEQRAPLEQQALLMGLDGAVRFVGALEETAPALAAMDAFVFLPASEEGFGLSLLEAMASGVPIIGVRRGQGAAWVLDQIRAAVIVPPDDEAALATAVERVLTDRPYATALAAAAREAVAQRYSAERMVDEVEAVYRELVPSDPTGRPPR